jgi:hypothetical protein
LKPFVVLVMLLLYWIFVFQHLQHLQQLFVEVRGLLSWLFEQLLCFLFLRSDWESSLSACVQNMTSKKLWAKKCEPSLHTAGYSAECGKSHNL